MNMFYLTNRNELIKISDSRSSRKKKLKKSSQFSPILWRLPNLLKMAEDNPDGTALKEYFKIIKDYHRLLLLVSATILLFALAPDETKVYKDGIAELKNFMTYSESKKITGYMEYLDEVAAERAKKLKIMESLKEVVGPEGISGVVYVNEDPIVNDKKGIKLLADLQGLDEDKLEQMADGTMSEIGQKLSNYPNFYLFEPDMIKLKETLIKKGFRDSIAKGYKLVDFRLSDSENGLEDKSSTVGLLLNGISTYTAEFKTDASGGNIVYSNGGIRGNLVKQKVLTVAEWIEKTDTINNLSKFVKKGIIFPSMKQIWGEVMNKKPQDAYFGVEAKWEEKKINEKISVLGLSFPANLILLGCPLTMFVFMLYYRSHLQIVDKQIKKRGIIRGNIVFPWVGLYDGFTNNLLTLLSSWFLPSLSIIALFVRLWTPYQLTFWLALSLGLGVLIISPGIYLTTRKIKKGYT